MVKLTPRQVDALVQLATSQVGVRHDGPNTGPMIEAYQRSAGNGPGASWCCDFIVWLLTAIVGNAIPLRRSGSCHDVLAEAQAEGRSITNPVRGAIGYLIDPTTGLAHHTFLCTSSVDSNEVVKTIEGNTNDDGSTNGIGVFARTRKLDENVEFVLLT
jgi:hypothetical protein